MTDEIKERFNIKKIRVRDIFLFVAAIIVIAAIGAIAKKMKGNFANIEIVQAQGTCWTMPSTGCGGSDSAGSDAGGSCGGTDCCDCCW